MEKKMAFSIINSNNDNKRNDYKRKSELTIDLCSSKLTLASR